MQGLGALRATLLGRLGAGSFGLFLVVGLGGLATDAAVFQVLVAVGAAPTVARAVSIVAATVVTWQLNRRFVFDAGERGMIGEASRYAAVALVAQGINYLGFILLCQLMPGIVPIVFLLLCSAGVAVASFAGQRLFTFRQP